MIYNFRECFNLSIKQLVQKQNSYKNIFVCSCVFVVNGLLVCIGCYLPGI